MARLFVGDISSKMHHGYLLVQLILIAAVLVVVLLLVVKVLPLPAAVLLEE